MKRKVFCILLVFIFSLFLFSCTPINKPFTIYSKGETSSYKYELVGQDEDETSFIIDYKIDFKEKYYPLKLKKIECQKAYDEFINPNKIIINNVEMLYQENIDLTESTINLLIYTNKTNFDNRSKNGLGQIDIHLHIYVEYKKESLDNIFTDDIETIASFS